jgi:hypothetical protein
VDACDIKRRLSPCPLTETITPKLRLRHANHSHSVKRTSAAQRGAEDGMQHQHANWIMITNVVSTTQDPMRTTRDDESVSKPAAAML